MEEKKKEYLNFRREIIKENLCADEAELKDINFSRLRELRAKALNI
jgi:hypothetical protein